MAGDDATSAQLIGWTLTGFGILISLSWNYYNHYRTNKTARELRFDQYRSSQWARIRGKIDKSIDDLLDTVPVILKQAQDLDPEQPEKNGIGIVNLILVHSQDQLASALSEADRSPYCDGEDWSTCANGAICGLETSWDLVLSALADAEYAKTKEDKLKALSKISQPIGIIREKVRERCRIQDIELDPQRI